MSNRRFYCGLCERWHGEDPTCAAQRPKAPHVHEKWQLQESAQGGMYCAACGEAVSDHTNGSQ